MLYRLFLTLLIACLAFPAAAMSQGSGGAAQQVASAPCHGSPDTAGHPADPDPAEHRCIGCAPLVSALAGEEQAPALPGLTATGVAVPILTSIAPPPATPPPRA